MLLDYDLSSIQEARDLARKARQAQKAFAEYSQEEVDRIICAMSEAAAQNAEWLARMAVDETKFGVFADKVTKNLFAARGVYEYIKDMKTAGIIREDRANKVVEIAAPVGVIMGIVPSTNPTSTVIYKSLISLKSRNGIVFSPHPSAARCTYAAAQVLHEAAVKAGAPEGIIGCLSKVTMQATNELMKSSEIDLILATGGSAMVKAAYSSGKPAYGVGPGNVPAFIEASADIPHAVSCIIASKTFDNGTICASEQAVVVEESIKDQVIAEFKRQGGYFMNAEETAKVCRILFTPRGMNPAVVGRSAQVVAQMAGITIPEGTKVLIGEQAGVGKEYPLSHEKLTTVLGFYVEKDWRAACERCLALLEEEGIGHTLVVHSRNEEVINEFALKKPVFRILVNTPSALGGVGYTTGLAPSFTLGCGTWGGSSTSDNVTPLHLINIKRLAHGIKEYTPSWSKGQQTAAVACAAPVVSAPTAAAQSAAPAIAVTEIEKIVRQVMASLQIK
ncbi:acetaldehyde dehydrogenase (acetylating) [Desulfurispora thermophila]|uniref:acetaldehyde dehydrogenase (acetylating) n=1 Tax=Desulfurispora thermophila TaxID=265470 RepID=UPI00036BB6AC|nr:acetaldehyde dehydrogenase (acetylating) [Desulfurispora thermophila]